MYAILSGLWQQDVKRERKSKTGDRNKNQTTIYTLRKRKNKNLFSFDLHNLINRYILMVAFNQMKWLKTLTLANCICIWDFEKEKHKMKNKKLSIEIENYA